MSKITDFLRKIGLLHVSSGDSVTGEYDSREDLKKEAEAVADEAPVETQPEPEGQQESQEEEAPKQQF